MTEFTRTQTLVSRIQSILREYPCGDTIIYELVQNADDAVAKSATIVLDPGTGASVDSLAAARDDAIGWNPSMTSDANPALYFHNNAVFTDRDLANIKRIGGDEGVSKRHDATKVGRFGVGFNSTFHLSDVVAFVTETKLLVMDPACDHLPKRDGRALEGLMWNFTKYKSECASPAEEKFVEQLLDRFEESGLGFSREKSYPGTIFRLALRQRPTKFWRVVHPVANVMKLLGDFFESARVSMVLLKNIVSIQARVLTRTAARSTPVANDLYSITANWSSNAVKMRGSILEWLKNYTQIMQALIAATDDLDAPPPDADKYRAKLPAPIGLALDITIDYKTSAHFEPAPSISQSTLMRVAHQLGPGNGWAKSSVWELSDLAARHHDPIFVPWSAAITDGNQRINGRMLCFFPIQGTTQLPLHLHGYFQLSSDRQSVISIERSKWNRAMAQEVVPHAFAACITRLCGEKRPSYHMWPSGSYSDSTVRLMAQSTIELLVSQPCIVTPGGYRRLAETLVFPDTRRDVHGRLLMHCKNMATCVDVDVEIEWLYKIARAAKDLDAKYVRLADAIDYREVLANAATVKPPMNADIASILFYRCISDGKYATFASLGSSKPIPILPLHDGTVGHWSSTLRGANNALAEFIIANTKEEHEVLAALPGVAAKLVRWFDSETSKPPQPGVKGPLTAASPVQPGAPAAAAGKSIQPEPIGESESDFDLAVSVANRKALRALVDMQSVVKMVTSSVLIDTITSVVHQPLYALTADAAQQEPPLLIEAISSKHYDFLPQPLKTPSARVNALLLAKVLAAHATDSALFGLPLLPVMAADQIPDPQRPAPRQLEAVSCKAPLSTVVATVDKSADPTTALGVIKALTRLGARALLSGIISPKLIAGWNMGAEIGRVHVLHLASREGLCALEMRLNALGDKSASELTDAFGPSAVCDAWFKYLTYAQPQLVASDTAVARRLPIFTDFWGRKVNLLNRDLVSRTGDLVDSLPPLFLPAKGVPQFALDALHRDQPAHSAVHKFTLLAPPVDAAKPLLSSMAIAEATPAEIIISVATALTLPNAALPRTAAANDAWCQVLAAVARLDDAQEQQSKLMRAAVDALKTHPFLPGMYDGVFLRPVDCINPAALVHMDLLVALLVQLQGKMPARPKPQGGGGESPALTPGRSPKEAPPPTPEVYPPMFPLLSSFEQPATNKKSVADRSAAAHRDPVLGSALKVLGALDRLDGSALQAAISAFAKYVVPSTPPETSLQYSAALLVALDMAERITPDRWFALRQIPFVPVTATGLNVKTKPAASTVAAPDGDDVPAHDVSSAKPHGISFMAPNQCVFPAVFVLNPIGEFSCVALEQLAQALPVEQRRSFARLANQFGWEVKPTAAQMVDYVNWTGTADRDLVRHRAQKIWSVYEHFERQIAKNCDNDFDRLVQASALKELGRLNVIYFPERRVAIKRSILARHPSAHRLEPYLAAVDRTQLDRFPLFFEAIRIPEVHDQTLIMNTIANLCGNGKVALTDAHRRVAADMLAYLCEISTKEFIDRNAKTIFVPTTDGKAAQAGKVVYDFFNAEAQAPRPDVMHSCVTSDVARHLGMAHSGQRYIEQLRKQGNMAPKKNQGSSFLARGPRYSLTNAIKRILGDYSDHQAVLLEMLQNADDAGAKRISFFLDNRRFKQEKEGLLGENMARCQGPALVIFNDATFSDQDFDALMDIGCGNKEGDSMKIGRFGVGFNTVYHLTDCPSLVSRDKFLFFDPALQHIDAASAENPGLMISHPEDPQLKTHFPHQFAPYELFGVDLQKPYSGTLFRLPLRVDRQNYSLSDREWATSDVREMFREFSELMRTCLLFLKNVGSVDLNEVEADGKIHRLYHVGCNNLDHLREHRKAIEHYILSNPITAPRPKAPLRMSTPVVLLLTRGQSTRAHHFVLTTYVQSPHSIPDDVADALPPKMRSKLLQWISIATEVHPKTRHCLTPDAKGTLACFLPLPVLTGLPSYIHGCFTLSSDRRGLAVEAFGSTQSWEVKWNNHLLKLASQAFADTVQFMAHDAPLTSVDDRIGFYATWPVADRIVTQLKPICAPFFETIVSSDSTVLWAEVGKWVSISSSCFVKPKAAPAGGASSRMDIPDCPLSHLVLASLFEHEELVVVSEPIKEAILQATRELSTEPPQQMSVALVVRMLQRRTASAEQAFAIPFETVFPRLAQCELNIKIRELVSVATYVTTGDDLVNLTGAPLLLLSNPGQSKKDLLLGVLRPGEFLFSTPFPDSSRAVLFEKMFPDFQGHVNPAFWAQLQSTSGFKADFWEGLGAVKFYAKNFAEWIKKHGPPFLQGVSSKVVGRSADPEVDSWLSHAWRFLAKEVISLSDNLDDLGLLKEIPLIPAKRGPERIIVPLGQSAFLLSGDADEEIQNLLAMVGIESLDRSFKEFDVVRRLCKIAEVDGTMVADVLRRAQNLGRFKVMTGEQRDNLLQYLLKTGENNRGFFSRVASRLGANSAIPMADTIRDLPLFECVDAFGNWTYTSLVVDAKAIPEGLSVSAVCAGLYRKPIPQLNVQRATISEFFRNKFFPLYDTHDAGSRMLAAQHKLGKIMTDDDMPTFLATLSTLDIPCPMAEILPLPAEIEYWKMLRSSEIEELKGVISCVKFIPLPCPYPRLTTAESQKLLNQVTQFIISRKVEYRELLEEVEQFAMVRHLQSQELKTVDTRRRAAPGMCVRPMTARNAPVPTCISMLMQHASNCAFKVVPDVIWNDPAMQALLQTVGVNTKASSECIVASARAFADITKDHPPIQKLRDCLRDWGFHDSTNPRMSPEFVMKSFHDLGVSIALAAETYGDADTMVQLRDIAFLMPVQTCLVAGQMIRQTTDTFKKPSDMVRYSQAALCFSRRPVASPLLDHLKTLILDPEAEEVLSHLFDFNLSGKSDPQTRLRTANAIDECLESIYGWLVRERLHDVTKNKRMVEDPLFAVPRRISEECRANGFSSEQLPGETVPLAPASAGAAAADPDDDEGGLTMKREPSEQLAVELTVLEPQYRKLVPYSCLMAANQSIDSVAPYLFQIRDFDGSPNLQQLLRCLPPLETPRPLAVARRIPGSARALLVFKPPQRQATQRYRIYANLLKLLVHSAEYHRQSLERNPDDRLASLKASSRHVDPKEVSAESETRELGAALQRLPLLLANGEFASLEEATVADSPGMLRRIRHDALKLVHPSISMATCRALAVPSMLLNVREEPYSAAVLSRTSEVRAWNAMLNSPDFVHSLMRICETEKMMGRDNATATFRGRDAIQRPRIARTLRLLSVERVASIKAKITDARTPNEDLANNVIAADDGDVASSRAAFNPKTHTIYLVLRDAATPAGQSDLASAPFRLAQELNKLLNGAISNIAPLAAMCNFVSVLGTNAIVDLPSIVDSFDCVTLDTAMGVEVVEGNVALGTIVYKRGKVLLPDMYRPPAPEGTVGKLLALDFCLDFTARTPSHVLVPDSDRLYRWRKPTRKAHELDTHSISLRTQPPVLVVSPIFSGHP